MSKRKTLEEKPDQDQADKENFHHKPRIIQFLCQYNMQVNKKGVEKRDIKDILWKESNDVENKQWKSSLKRMTRK